MTQRIKFIVTLIVVFSCFSSPASAVDPRTIYFERTIHPKGSYLRTCNDDPLINIIPIADSNPVNPGDWVVLRRDGFFQHGPGRPDNGQDLLGVFSAYATLYPDSVSRLNRLKDTIYADPGYGYETRETLYKCVEHEGEEANELSTDIPQDFFIGANMLQIPYAAQYLYTTTNSAFHGDNLDPNGDFSIRFTDEVRWEGRSSDASWFSGSNWDTWYAPRSEFGVSFDKHGDTSVTGAIAPIRYLRIVEGIVRFDAVTYLELLACEDGKIPFIVGDSDGAKMFLTGGKLNACRGIIGYNGEGTLYIFAGGSVEATVAISIGAEKESPGTIWVAGTDSLLTAGHIYVGPIANGTLFILQNGRVHTSYTTIGGGIYDNSSYVIVGSGSHLSADETIRVEKNGILSIDGGAVGTIHGGIEVKEGGALVGCNSGIVVGVVLDKGGTVAPGCLIDEPIVEGDLIQQSEGNLVNDSTGTLIIDGDFIQESAGTLVLEVSGYNKGEDYDVLEVTGSVTLNGTLQVNFVNGFAPKQGDIFQFANFKGPVSQNLSKVETNCVADDFQNKIEMVGGKLTMTALNDARAIPCGGPKAMPWIPLLLLDE